MFTTETIDNILPQLIRSWMSTFFTVISTVVVISYSTPIFLSVIVPVGILYYFIQVSRFYLLFYLSASSTTLFR